MRNRRLLAFGKWLMQRDQLRICIIDDERDFFHPRMLALAEAAGFPNIERFDCITAELLANLLEHPRDIVILDIHGVTDPTVAKDGFEVASLLYRSTKSYVVVTSAHSHPLSEAGTRVDHVLENRLLTSVDFVSELENMVTDYLSRKTRFYSKIGYKIGFGIAKGALLAPV